MLFLILLPFALLFVFFVGGNLYTRWYLDWENRHRHGLSYYGKPLVERRRFRDRIRLRALPMRPLVALEKALRKPEAAHRIPSFNFEGIWAPTYSCTEKSFEKAVGFQPGAGDIFIVTQMKCGTTWMQQLVFEVLHRGEGDLSDTGFGHLYAASPWLESIDGVSVAQAPRLGKEKSRLIKTHLPTRLCPYDTAARFIYVTRHPVSCFASIRDYFHLMTGPLAPPEDFLASWFLSPHMWWLPWPDHAAGWAGWAAEKSNVFMTSYEAMKADLPAVLDQVAAFLTVPLSEEEKKKILTKCSFEWMKQNEELFEMSPPNLFSVGNTYFKSGKADRSSDLLPETLDSIRSFCRSGLRGRPAARTLPYSDLLES